MRISCLAVSLFPSVLNGEMSLREYMKLLRSLELDGFDVGMVLLKNHTPRFIKAFTEEMSEEGIRLTMVTASPDFTHPDALQREREFDFLVHDIALASALGANFLRVTAGQAHPGIKEDDAIKWASSYLKKAVPAAEKYGIKLVYENHSTTGSWHYMDFSNPPHIFLQIAEELKETSIGINFDTANILIAGKDNTLEVLDKVIDKVVTIHVAETGTKGKMDPVLIGTGLVPFAEIFSYLKSKKFDGWLCIEEWGNKGKEGVKQAVEYVRKTWENS